MGFSNRTGGKSSNHIGVIVVIFLWFISSLVGKTTESSQSSSIIEQNQPAIPSIRIVPDHCESTQRGVFDKIYATGFWQTGLRKASDFYSDAEWPTKAGRQISASGPGSNLGFLTQASLAVLKDAIVKYDVKSMIDVPSGDANWIFDSFLTDTLPLYIGLDVTSAVIEVNKQRFEHHKNKHFFFWDATECDLPMFVNETSNSEEKQSVDLVHVRDVIQHLTLDQGVKYFCRVFKSGARVLVTTSHDGDWQGGKNVGNKDIKEGDYYNNDLFAEPFSFPESQRENCYKHEAKERRAYTCTFDLTEGSWVEDFILSRGC